MKKLMAPRATRRQRCDDSGHRPSQVPPFNQITISLYGCRQPEDHSQNFMMQKIIVSCIYFQEDFLRIPSSRGPII